MKIQGSGGNSGISADGPETCLSIPLLVKLFQSGFLYSNFFVKSANDLLSPDFLCDLLNLAML